MPRKILAIALVIFVAIPLGTLVYLGPVFKIKYLNCQLKTGDNCPENLIALLEPLKNKSFFFSPLKRNIQQLDLNLYQVETINKVFPNTLLLEFSHRPNSYFIKINHDDRSLLVAENGLIQNIETQQQLPQIKVEDWSEPLANEAVNPELHQLNLELIRSLATEKIEYQQLIIHSSQEIELTLQKNLRALAQKKDLTQQITKLAIILNEIDLRAIDLQINTIDLRFKFPVLKKL